MNEAVWFTNGLIVGATLALWFHVFRTSSIVRIWKDHSAQLLQKIVELEAQLKQIYKIKD